MADTKISGLAAATAFNDADVTVIVQGGENKKLTKAVMFEGIGAINYITSNTTAVNNGRYIANGTLTVSDIALPVAGSNYEVIVRGGSVTIDSQAYSEGNIIQRIHDGTSWATYVFDSFGTLTIEFASASAISTANSWQGKLVKINTNGFDCVIQLNNKVDFVAGKYNGGTVEIIAGTQTRVLADNQFLLTGNYDTLSVVVDPSDDTKSVLYTTIR